MSSPFTYSKSVRSIHSNYLLHSKILHPGPTRSPVRTVPLNQFTVIPLQEDVHQTHGYTEDDLKLSHHLPSNKEVEGRGRPNNNP